MSYRMHLTLPRARASVPIARHLARGLLGELGVTEDCSSDIELALSEACTNVLLHAGDAVAGYEVVIEADLDAGWCRIEVLDGGGFDHAALSFQAAALSAERGRGMHLIGALADEVRFDSDPDTGTRVVMLKRLERTPARRASGHHRLTPADLRRFMPAPD